MHNMQRNLPNFSVGSSRVALVGMRRLLLSVQAWKQFLSHANYILSSCKDAEEVIKAKQNALFQSLLQQVEVQILEPG